MPLSQIGYINTLQNLPAFIGVESAIATAWLNEHYQEYDTVNFNVRLGQGPALPAGSPDYIKKFVRASHAKRADMILMAGNVATIVEVKLRIGSSALGQLHVYQQLYMQENPDVKTVNLIAIGVTIEPDVEAILEKNGIAVELFPSIPIP